MINFRPISMQDKALFDKALHGNKIASCDYSFATIICWQHHFQTEIAQVAGCIILHFIDNDGLPCYLSPLGDGDKVAAVKAMIDDARCRGERFSIGAVTHELYNQLELYLGHIIRAEFYRDQFEYIYSRENLATLSGSHLQSKRNHVNKFCSLYPNYEIREINSHNAFDCIKLYNQWRCQIECRKDDSSEMINEQMSVEIALNYFDELHLKGITLWVDNKMIAFAYGEMLTADTFLTHAEKALTIYEGSYAMINKLTAQFVAKDALYINREEDMGLEYLRQAKMSYKPVMLLEKGRIFLIDE